MRALCIGEALVDLVCERPVAGLADADSFVPRFGGMAANVAVVAARHGGDVALAGGAGDDAWGRWLAERLEAEGVGLDWFALLPDEATAVAFVTVDGAGEPSYQIYGDAIAAAMHALGPRIDAAVDASDGIFVGSNTLVGQRERELTMRAIAHAGEHGKPVVFDANLRLHRWPSTGEAIAASRACVPGSFLVKCNRVEAQLLTGEAEPDAAADALVSFGARLAVVTMGADGALLRGEFAADVPGVPARTVSTVGAGDTLMGVLLARVSGAGYYAPAAAAALPEAVEAAARATEHWAAIT